MHSKIMLSIIIELLGHLGCLHKTALTKLWYRRRATCVREEESMGNLAGDTLPERNTERILLKACQEGAQFERQQRRNGGHTHQRQL